MRSFREWLAPPTFTTLDQTIAARLLNRLLVVAWFLYVVMFVVFLFFPTNRGYNLGIIGLVGALNFGQWLILRRGGLRVAGGSYLLMLWVLAVWSALRFGGLHTVYPVLFLVVVVLASTLFGPRVTWIITSLNLATLGVLWAFGPTYTEALTRQDPENMGIARWTVYTTALILIAAIVTATQRAITTTLATLRARNTALEAEIAERERIQAQLRQSEARLQSMFDNAPFAIMMMNMDRTLRAANPRARQMFDITPPGTPPAFRTHRLHPDDDPKHQQLFHALAAGDATTVQTESRLLIPGQDALTWVRVTLSRVEANDTEGPYVLAILEDISEARLAAQQRLELQLERERLAFLQDFVGKMTHDLKTPLSVIKTSTYLLRRKSTDTLTQTYTDRIDQQVATQMEMIENILAVARLDHLPELNRQPTDLNTLLRNVVDTQRLEVMRQGHTLDLDLAPGLPPCLLDADEFARALTNLLSNAVKYTPAGGNVTLRTLQASPTQIRLCVVDNGIGIPPEALPHIFDRFYRADSARQAYHGTGLGLAIVREIIERHDGTVTVESQLHTGTTFIVHLPVHSAVAALTPPSAEIH